MKIIDDVIDVLIFIFLYLISICYFGCRYVYNVVNNKTIFVEATGCTLTTHSASIMFFFRVDCID